MFNEFLADIEANPKIFKNTRRIMNKHFFGPPYAVLNISKLGYRYFRIFLRISPIHLHKFLNKFSQHPNIGWVFETTGWTNAALGFWALNNSEISEINESIRREIGKFGEIVYQSELTYLAGFGSRPFHGVYHPKLILDSKIEKEKIAAEEFELLKQLSLDASLSYEEYASLLNIKPKKIFKLLNKLEQLGIIVGYQARVNYPYKYFKVFLDTTGLSTLDVDKLSQSLWNDSGCIYIERANGKYDFEFEIIVKRKTDFYKYLKGAKDFKIVEFKQNIYTNLLPISKSLDINELFSIFTKEKNKQVINLCQSKLWYLTLGGSRAWLKAYEDKNYAKLMQQSETTLFNSAFKEISKRLNKDRYYLIDLGSGDGKKALEFIKIMPVSMVGSYYPIDINIVQLSQAINLHKKDNYKIQPCLLDFKNLSSKFPLQLNPNEGQIYLFLGGTYGNFNHREINSYLKRVIKTKNSILLVAINIRDFIPRQKIIDSYLNKAFQNYVIQPLVAFGFKEEDFIDNASNPSLKVNLEWMNNGISSFFILKSNKTIRDIKFKKGTRFHMTFSWKPTMNEFHHVLFKEFKIIRIFNNKNFALAVAIKK